MEKRENEVSGGNGGRGIILLVVLLVLAVVLTIMIRRTGNEPVLQDNPQPVPVESVVIETPAASGNAADTGN